MRTTFLLFYLLFVFLTLFSLRLKDKEIMMKETKKEVRKMEKMIIRCQNQLPNKENSFEGIKLYNRL